MQLFLQTCTPDIELSRNYFASLDFAVEDRGDFTLVYDQQMHMMIDHLRSGRTGLTLVKENWEDEVRNLSRLASVIKKDNVHYFMSPSGTRFALMAGEDVGIPDIPSTCLLGNYAGVSLETMDIETSMKILEVLGFQQSSGGVEQGWISYTDQSKNSISLMSPFACLHLFCNPSGTFFNKDDNPKIIAEVRKRKIPIYEEITAFNTKFKVDNILLREPGGLGFFVFND